LKLFIYQREFAEFPSNIACAKILNERLGCKIYNYSKIDTPVLRILIGLILAIKASRRIIRGNTLVYQFPPKVEVIPTILLSQLIRNRPVAIVHDLDYLRNIQNFGLRCVLDPKGFRMLRNSTVIIHQGRMWDLLVQNRIFPKSYINFWPHLISKENSQNLNYASNEAVAPILFYAGNLIVEKCGFLKDINKLERLIHLYGNTNFPIESTNILINPYFPEDTPPQISSPTIGLIWDGDSMTSLAGTYGDYQKLNLPAKLSLYLAMGIPVVVSSESNIAKFVIDSGIGICVNSLYEIPKTFIRKDWEIFENNSREIGKKVKNGDDLVLAFERLQ